MPEGTESLFVEVTVNGATHPMTVQIGRQAENVDDGIGPVSVDEELVERILRYVEGFQVDGQPSVWVPREEVVKHSGNRNKATKTVDWLCSEDGGERLMWKLDDSGPGRPRKVVASTRGQSTSNDFFA